MCSLAPLLWRSFFVCIVFVCRILRILYHVCHNFPSLTDLPKSGATDGGHAPELSQRPYQNHGLFAWKLETTQSTSSIITISSCHARLHKKMDWKSTDGAFSSRTIAHALISVQQCWLLFLFCLCMRILDHGTNFGGTCPRSATMMNGSCCFLCVCVESLIGITHHTQVELLSN